MDTVKKKKKKIEKERNLYGSNTPNACFTFAKTDAAAAAGSDDSFGCEKIHWGYDVFCSDSYYHLLTSNHRVVMMKMKCHMTYTLRSHMTYHPFGD